LYNDFIQRWHLLIQKNVLVFKRIDMADTEGHRSQNCCAAVQATLPAAGTSHSIQNVIGTVKAYASSVTNPVGIHDGIMMALCRMMPG
jgi:hypothetical protein